MQSQYLEELSDEAGKKHYQDKVAQLQATADPFCLLQRGCKEYRELQCRNGLAGLAKCYLRGHL